MSVHLPQPGDLILVLKSEWYALNDGQRLRVCEIPGWNSPDAEIYVAPRNQVRSFWGPQVGPPDGVQPETLSTSGGPFKTVPRYELNRLEVIGQELDWFWHWQDVSRAGGGVVYQKEVTLWRLPLLIDWHHRQILKYRREVSS